MPNSPLTLYRSYLKESSAKNTDATVQNSLWAILKTVEHLVDLNFYDRNRYDERLKALEADMEARDKAKQKEST